MLVNVGSLEGAKEGNMVGAIVELSGVGAIVGDAVASLVGAAVGMEVLPAVGTAVSGGTVSLTSTVPGLTLDPTASFTISGTGIMDNYVPTISVSNLDLPPGLPGVVKEGVRGLVDAAVAPKFDMDLEMMFEMDGKPGRLQVSCLFVKVMFGSKMEAFRAHPALVSIFCLGR